MHNKDSPALAGLVRRARGHHESILFSDNHDNAMATATLGAGVTAILAADTVGRA